MTGEGGRLHRTRLGLACRYRGLWLGLLCLHGHVFGSPLPAENRSAIEDAVAAPASAIPAGVASGADGKETVTASSHDRAGDVGGDTLAGGEERELQVALPPYPFFVTRPYANVVVYDSHDSNCDRNYDSPPISDPDVPGYPKDGTDVMRKRDMACGVAPSRFVFQTSNLEDYTDMSVEAKMEIKITCLMALFITSQTCENVLDGTGDLPTLEGCRFQGNEASIILATRLLPSHKYSITIKLLLPPGRNSASENSYEMLIKYFQVRTIEGTRSPVDLTHTIPNAKDESVYTDPYSQRGYITSFTWQPAITYSPVPGALSTYTFGLRTFGVMGNEKKEYRIDIIAYPTDVWRFGVANEACTGFNPNGMPGLTCQWTSFYGAPAEEANGMRLRVGATPLDNTAPPATFSVLVVNPMTAANMYWTATSFRIDNDQLPTEPYTVMLDKPIAITGQPTGSVAKWELSAISIEQWITLEFQPGNTLLPSTEYAGMLVILPPANFTVVDSSRPQNDDPKYNALPCTTWPIEARREGRWECPLGDKAVFKQTTYRIRLKVINPVGQGAAQSWRVELWPSTGIKYISGTFSLRGMPISGKMDASLAQENQLVGGRNILRIEFTPTQDAGKMPDTAFSVVAPVGFVITKTCSKFTRIEIPECVCVGSDANRFRLVFPVPDVIKAHTTYVFSVEVLNPDQNVPDDENYWKFDTTRPDGLSRDTARFKGFFLYPYLFSAFKVIPVSRRVGSQEVVVRFIPKSRIPFDDYIRIRAPVGVAWDADNLQYDTSNAATNAYTFATRAPTVIYATPEMLLAQLIESCKAHFEYGIRARVIIPRKTPTPNRWWVEQFRQTGQQPGNWRYLAASGAEGYRTQVLINTQVTPWNIVKEAWQNPTLIVFEGTVDLQPLEKSTLLGTTVVYPYLQVEAPPLFTYICPTTKMTYRPPYTVPLPSDVECEVNHNNLAEKNKLRLTFPSGMKALTRYAFLIDLVNYEYVDRIYNYYTLQTILDDEVIEDSTVDGYELADRMDNTLYFPATRENRVVEATNNKVTIIVGTVMELPFETILEVKAPPGFIFDGDCTDKVGPAGYVQDTSLWVPYKYAQLDFPEVIVCQNLATVDVLLNYTAHISLKAGWGLGTHAFYVTVTNPTFTPPPAMNFWGTTIYDRSMQPLMSEAYIRGFQIQVVLDPVLKAYNPAVSVAKENAINRVEVSFTLTTSLPNAQRCEIRVIAPEGFTFPSICRDFVPFPPLPKNIYCRGNGARLFRLILPQWHGVVHKTRYTLRFLVINPSTPFVNVTSPEYKWEMETRRADQSYVDINRHIPSFEMHERLTYFSAESLSYVGLNTTIFRFHFATTAPLGPQQTVRITPPLGTVFNGLENGACRDEDPQLINRLFPEPLIEGVTRMPEWIFCEVVSPTEVVLTNSESILDGRPLITGPVYQFFVKNVTNAQSTPALNIFKIEANTMTPLGKEVWEAESWTIFPELMDLRVTSSNPGFGLFTNFTIRLKAVTEVPEGGYVNITAPNDYYFGPAIKTALTAYNPLVSMPPPQGESPERPPPAQVTACEVLRPSNWACPFDFQQCRIYRELKELEGRKGSALDALDEAQMNSNKVRCDENGQTCADGDLSEFVTCKGMSTGLELSLQRNVFLPSMATFEFLVTGYNARQNKVDLDRNTWHFRTIDSDSQRTVLDEKGGVPGIILIGKIDVPSLYARNTMVESIENIVTITIKLTFPCPPRALLRITYPMDYRRNKNAAFQGSAVETGKDFPKQVEIRQMSLNVLELEAVEEQLPADTPMEITIGLSNREISPPRAVNVWRVEAFTKETGTPVLLNCNYDIEGFKIFGQFSTAAVTANVLSPPGRNPASAWFMLKSPLEASQSSEMRIWMPKGYKPTPNCGTDTGVFNREYNKNRAGTKEPFPNEIDYFDLPPGTYCFDEYDAFSDQYYIRLTVDGKLEYGFDYAFDFEIMNPTEADEPKGDANVWRFETLMHGVILHKEEDIPGFILEQIKFVTVTPTDTTSLEPFNRCEFALMSDKAIKGGSKLTITAPPMFRFICAFRYTDAGLSNTTTCTVQSARPNIAIFQTDSQDPKPPESPFKLFVYVSNPEFTPQDNWWDFEIRDFTETIIDLRKYVASFDVTGKVLVDIVPLFPFLGETNPLRINFVQTTIMNMADEGNEIVVDAPDGYIFPVNLTHCYLGLSNPADSPAVDDSGYKSSYAFPPDGIVCTGFNNRTAIVRLPNGTGLLRNSYTLEIDVENPGYQPNTSNTWAFQTRVRNEVMGQKIVDKNRSIPGFLLQELVPLRTDEGSGDSLSASFGLAFTLASAAGAVAGLW